MLHKAPGFPKLTQTSSSDIILEWYISWTTSREHAWMPLHHIPRTRLDALVSCTPPSAGRPGGAEFTGLHQHQRYRHTVVWSTGVWWGHGSQNAAAGQAQPFCSDRLHPIQLTGQCPWQHSTGAAQPWESQPNQKSISPDPNLMHASKPALWFLSAATAPL